MLTGRRLFGQIFDDQAGFECVRISRAVAIASSTLATTCEARARVGSSVSFASRSSALARMIPSWLFNRWNRSPRLGGSSTDVLALLGSAAWVMRLLYW